MAKSRMEEMQVTIEGMSDDDLLEFVRQIRSDRKVSKRIQRTTAKKTRAKAQSSLRKMLGAMTEEQVKELLGER